MSLGQKPPSSKVGGRRKRQSRPKHSGIVRAFRFAMDVPQAKAAKLFGACHTLCDWRNVLVDVAAEQRRENRRRKDCGEEPRD